MFERVGGVAGAVRLLAGGRAGGVGGIVLGYHDVVTDSPRTRYDVPLPRFRAQLRALRAWGLQLVPLADMVARLAAGGPVDGLVAVTFDDALEGVYRHAAPVLAELEVPFTVFAVSAELGTEPAWWPDAGRIMSREHLVALAEGGASIECHTRHHPSLPLLDGVARRDEVRGAKAELEDLTGRPVRLLAYPFEPPRPRGAGRGRRRRLRGRLQLRQRSHHRRPGPVPPPPLHHDPGPPPGAPGPPRGPTGGIVARHPGRCHPRLVSGGPALSARPARGPRVGGPQGRRRHR